MSLLKLGKIINTKTRAAKKFRKERWRRGFGCTDCGSIRAWKHRKLKNGLQKYRCEDCRHVFSDQSTTILRWNKRQMDSVAVVNHFSGKKMSIRDIALESELSKNSVERLQKLIRKTRGALYASIPKPQLSGVVENDETMIAGRWFWGAIERKGHHAVVEMIPDRSEFILTAKLWKHIEEGSTILTDEWRGYNPHPRFFNHYTVNHSKEFVHPHDKRIHTNTIEGLWAQLKRKLHRFCNGVSLHNIPDYLNEYFYLKNYDHSSKPTFFPLYCDKT